MYDTFTDIEGANKQSMIFQQDKKNKWIYRRHVSLENTVDGKLTYAEFQADLQKKLTPIDVDKSLKLVTVPEAVDALKSKGWAMTMDVSQITSGKSRDYDDLITRVNKKFQAYYDTLGDDPKWQGKLMETNKRTHALSEEIMALRRQEADEWLLKQLTRDADPDGTPENKRSYGLGLDRQDLVIEKHKSSVPGASTWEKVNLVRTFLEHPDPAALREKLRSAGIKNGHSTNLVKWSKNLGNPAFAKYGPGYSEQNKTHAQALSVWHTVHSSAKKRVNKEPASCER
ncbi:hypothetical protein CDV31_016930 [Fusarium ambrosium]|uniref:Uncharacterized protein n=1 Tax=Fusarium ambrosium TaxID=131363 RepID=A0A428RY84_9HYPO|nr:hypothetical protein CDV31_016930 [Fusarium ambrosium]